MENEYAFPDKSVLVNYLYDRLENPTLLKVQKSLYLLWAYYSATYGNIETGQETDISNKYPTELFKPNFEAWRYGPVDREVYRGQKKDEYSAAKSSFQPSTPEEKDIKLYIDDLLSDIDFVNDFGLVELTHKDHAWRDVYVEGERGIPIEASKIKSEYVQRFKESSAI